MNRSSVLHKVLALLLAGTAGLAAAQATAQQVTLSGVSGQKALLVIDGSPPRFVDIGQTLQGVKLLSLNGDVAVVDIGGQKQTLQVGGAPVSVGKAKVDGGGQRIVLTADPSGHFFPDGQINGKTVKFMVDTGATTVALSAAEAKRINIDFEKGKRVQMSTANGVSTGFLVKLNSVRVGDVVAYEVDAVISPQPMPFILLGNSFLNRFQMQKTNDQLTLEKRF